jgi:hypothetical protein
MAARLFGGDVFIGASGDHAHATFRDFDGEGGSGG